MRPPISMPDAAGQNRGMLTRSQVARRLGKSIATVRRLEGTLLHPRTDPSGIRRFDAREVDALHNEVRHGRRLPNGLRSLDGNGQDEGLRREVTKLKSRVEDLEATLAELLDALSED